MADENEVPAETLAAADDAQAPESVPMHEFRALLERVKELEVAAGIRRV